MNYILSRQAITDLQTIWQFTAENWSTKQANDYYRLNIEKIYELPKYPQLGKSFDFARPGYRGLIVKSHIVFYRISKDTIEIIRILHQSVDVENKF